MAQDLSLVSKILQEYTEDIQEAITKSAEEVANEGVAKLQGETSTYQVRTGKYNRGWRQKTEIGARYVHATISNKEYQLTHLLEYGHATKNGGRTRAFKHIEPVEEYVKKEFTKKVEQAIKGGR